MVTLWLITGDFFADLRGLALLFAEVGQWCVNGYSHNVDGLRQSRTRGPGRSMMANNGSSGFMKVHHSWLTMTEVKTGYP